MHTISIHRCLTAVIDTLIGQAGWKRLQMWSLSLNKSYIFHHHQQRQHFALTITYSRICASRTFISPQYFRILHPLFCILPHLSTRGARACAVWGGESGRSDSISQFLNIYNYNISKIHKIDNISNTRYLLFFSVTSTSKSANLQHIQDSQITKYSQHFK